jgi:peptidoglycan/xylan/chitin deacetylase (PgdA/CDA1 family)
LSLVERAVTRITRAARTLAASATSDPAVVLMYHRIGAPASPADILAVSPGRFREQMRALRERFDPVAIDVIERRAQALRSAGPRRRPVVVTFDDGYADNLLAALPILEEFSIPATVFVTTGMVERRAEFWWDEIEEIVLRRLPAGRWPRLEGVPADVFPGAPGEGPKLPYLRLCVHLKIAGREAIDAALAALRAHAGMAEPSSRDVLRTLTLKELRRLASHPLITIGSHTVTHARLGGSGAEAQRRELAESKAWLERELGREVTTLAYPFGAPGDFDEETCAAARDTGYLVGLTTVEGVATPRTPAYEVPRMFAHDWTGEEFARRLSRYFWIG